MAAAGRHQLVESLQTQSEMGPPLVTSQRVHLVDDDGVHVAQDGPRGRGGEQQVQRLGSGHQQIRRGSAHGGPLGRRGVAGPHRHRQARSDEPETGGLVGDAHQRELQVLVDVGGQGTEGRDIDDSGPHGGGLHTCGPVGMGAISGIDGHQKSGQRLTGAGGGGDQHVLARGDARPGGPLRFRGSGREPTMEPAGHRGMEGTQNGVWRKVIEAGPGGGFGQRRIGWPASGRVEVEREWLWIGPWCSGSGGHVCIQP